MFNNPNLKDVVLALGDSADAGHCGSCVFFKRGDSTVYSHPGLCKFTFPPHVQIVPYDPECVEKNRVDDTYKCDLYQPDGKTYVVSHRVGPGVKNTP